MNIKSILLICCLAIIATQLPAQSSRRAKTMTERQLNDIVKQYEDSLASLVSRHQADTLTTDLDVNPRYYRLFGIPTLYQSSVTNTFKGDERIELYPTKTEENYLPLDESTSIAKNDAIEKKIDHALFIASVENPQNFTYTEKQVMAEQVITTKDVVSQAPTANIIPEIVLQQDKENKAVGVDMKVKKPNFWKTSGSAKLQFTQNYISGNWTQGGESTNTLVSELVLKANYNDQQRIQWDNTFEAKLGFTTAPSDTVHKYRTNTDLLRLTSKLGLKAFKSWSYTIEVVSKTQILRNYKSNSNTLNSAFIAPAETKVGVGMDYKKSLKNFNISINLAPLAYRWVYIGDRDVKETNFGVKKGHRSLQEYGSSMTLNSTWKIAKNITWKSRIDAFSNYEKMSANWENTFDFAISKYLSTTLFLHGRFDDGVPKRKGYNYFQFKEFLQFGLSYNW